MNKTISYYNSNSEIFAKCTVAVDFGEIQNRFIKKLPKEASILDFGCGSGRDTKFFLDLGYKVLAIDGSEKMCEMASQYTGIKVKNMLFQELNDIEKYDGIWACSSILHLPRMELAAVLSKMCGALKECGIIYTSFKYGEFTGERNGRFFSDFTEESIQKIVEQVDNLHIEECWITSDVRPEREEEQWLNLILRKE